MKRFNFDLILMILSHLSRCQTVWVDLAIEQFQSENKRLLMLMLTTYWSVARGHLAVNPKLLVHSIAFSCK